MGNNSANNPFHQDTSVQGRRKRKKKDKDYNDLGFMHQKVDLVDSVLFPKGYENIMLAVYFITVPYITGLLFIFFYIGKGDTTVFLSLNSEHSFLITWAVGYEIVALLILLWIAKLWLASFFRVDEHKKSKKFKIP